MQTVLHLGDGRTVTLPTELLLGAPRSGLEQGMEPRKAGYAMDTGRATGTMTSEGGEQVIPLIAEHAEVGKRVQETGRVRIHRGTETFTDTVGLELTRTEWRVERVPVGQAYQDRPEVRQEGDVMVFPLVEERLVAKREYFLIEEVRVQQVATTSERTARLELKRDVVTVEREGAVDPPNEGSIPR